MPQAKASRARLDIGLRHVERLLEVPSVTNRVTDTADYVCKVAQRCGYEVTRQIDDTVFVHVPGSAKGKNKRTIGYGAHLDRIGLMVDELCEDGTVKFSAIGGLYPGHLMDGVIAEVQTAKGNLAGVIGHVEAPIHKLGLKKFENREQSFAKLRLRLDACIGCTKEDGKKKLEKLGVEVGQLVMLDPLLVIDRKHKTLRSRWLDNTLGCAVLLALMEDWSKRKFKPHHDIALIFSAAEEAGMGGTSVIYPELTDFVAVDTGQGEDLKRLETVVITHQSYWQPKSLQLVQELEAAAKKDKVPFERVNGGSTDADQIKEAGFKGRVGAVKMPILGMHSIENSVFSILDGAIALVHAHAAHTR